MSNNGQEASKWLRKVDEDQNLSGLNNMDLTLRNGPHKPFFVSQVIQPVVSVGSYDNITGRYEPGSGERGAILIETSTVSAQTTTFLIPAGEVWEIIGIGARDANRVSQWSFEYNDGTNGFPLPGSYVGPTQPHSGVGLCMAFDNVRILGTGSNGITAYAAAYVAADIMRVALYYRRVS